MVRAGGRGPGWSGGWRKDWDPKNGSEVARHEGGDYECLRERAGAGEGSWLKEHGTCREPWWSTAAGEREGQDTDLFRLSPKTDGNPRLSFKPGDRVHTGLVTGQI